MKRLYIDTNIVIDLLVNRAPFYKQAAKLFSYADKNKVKLSIFSLTFDITIYLLQKSYSPLKTREILRDLKILVNVLPFDDKIIELALNDTEFDDIEDALQYFSAVENKQNIIITRNLKDFKASKLPVMTAGDFLRTTF